jgi:hypothetical protein
VITIENPTDSWLWELPFVIALYSYCFFVDLHACMFGGLRRKRTSFLTNESKFQALQIFVMDRMSMRHGASMSLETSTLRMKPSTPRDCAMNTAKFWTA